MKKTQKVLLISGISAVALYGVWVASFKIMENSNEYEKAQLVMESREAKEQIEREREDEKIEAQREAKAKAAELEAKTAIYDGIEFETGLDEGSTETEVMDVMHKMTHQKVRSQDKWGAIPMSPKIIEEVYKIVDSSDFQHRDRLLSIAARWRDFDFSTIVQDHNFFWEDKAGTVGKAHGTLSRAEEVEFIEVNFK
ncbi:DUF6241 domain-containing protein [Peribacillus frigoritolerans]|uniref:DUF6241 domain-containing protein n=1 Tax=Peribacillus TaxID=2675229 RepID=UPI000BA53368|nr:DUF6241 domain-containing protein [Peribacillus simplex]MBX9955858.1 hypothetical protein [Peribacillus simplex]PAL11445.1 hypothetical protein B8W99_16430 [Peribacillus simplex]